jgi:hypothetical protein
MSFVSRLEYVMGELDPIFSRVVRLWFGLMLLLAWSVPPAHAAPQGEVQEVEKPAGLFDRLAILARQQIRESGVPGDHRALAMLLGNDPERIFAYVRDEIAFEPYRGILRGSAGVLIGRGGNAIEQAHLLLEMLQGAGHEARLVSSPLAPAQAEVLLKSFLKRDPLEQTPIGSHLPGEARQQHDLAQAFLAETGVPDEVWQQWTDQSRFQTERLREQLHSEWQGTEQFVRESLREAGIELGAGAAGNRQKMLAAIAEEHVWVQRQDKQTGEWIDLDPSFADAEAGQARAEGAAAAYEPGAGVIHQLQFRLLMRRGAGEKSEDVALLEVPLELYRVARLPIRFAISFDSSQMPAGDALVKTPPQELRRRMMAIDTYQATLSIGPATHSSPLFNMKGETSQPGQWAIGRKMEQAARALSGLLDALDAPPEAEQTLQRLWVELILDGPEGRSVQERVLLDDQPMRDKSLLTEWDLFPQTHALSREYGDYVTGRYVATVAPILARLARTGTPPSLAEVTEVQQVMISTGFIFATQRQQELAAILGALPAEQRPAVLWSQPNLFIARQNLRVMEEEAFTRTQLDIVRNGIGFLYQMDDPRLSAEMALRMGVIDTCLEELVVEGALTTGGREGTASYFAKRRLEGRDEVSVFQARQVADAAGAAGQAAMPAYTRQWIAQAKPADSVAIVPAQWSENERAFYFWSVDPATGECAGRSWEGNGAATVEYTHVLLAVSLALCGIGAATGSNVTSTVCCVALAIVGFKVIAAEYVLANMLAMSFSLHAAVIPQIDPCSYAGDLTGF